MTALCQVYSEKAERRIYFQDLKASGWNRVALQLRACGYWKGAGTWLRPGARQQVQGSAPGSRTPGPPRPEHRVSSCPVSGRPCWTPLLPGRKLRTGLGHGRELGLFLQVSAE